MLRDKTGFSGERRINSDKSSFSGARRSKSEKPSFFKDRKEGGDFKKKEFGDKENNRSGFRNRKRRN